MIRVRPLLPAVLAACLCACASAPLHYYTLVPPATDAVATTAAPFPFELLPVHVPAQVDQQPLVVRQGRQGVQVLDGERWIAPLPDEIRAALSADLTQALGARDAAGFAAGTQPRWRVQVDIRRFDSMPGEAALVDADWSVRAPQGGGTIHCSSRLREPVGEGYAALVQGHQQALAALARQIAQATRTLAAGTMTSCPSAQP